MRRVWSFIKVVPAPLWVIIGLAVAISFFYWQNFSVFGFYFRDPDPEQLFYQTLERNLNSRSVTLRSQVTLKLDGLTINLLTNDLQLGFQDHPQGRWAQRSLVYHSLLSQHYPDQAQLANYQDRGIESLPQQEWYHQQVLASQEEMYMRHWFSVQPPRSDWQQLSADPLDPLPQSQDWYAVPFQESTFQESVYHFLIGATASDGFLFGALDKSQRRALMKQLRQAYSLNLEELDTFYQDGRLHYRYRVRLKGNQFVLAFIDYYNLQIPTESEQFERNEQLFIRQDVVYDVVLDVDKRQFVQIRHPVVLHSSEYQNYLLLSHQYSLLIYDLQVNQQLPLMVETTIVDQHQRLKALVAPAAKALPSNRLGEEELADD